MAIINRLRVSWNGQTALPGLSTFYFHPVDTSAVADVAAFFDGIRGLFASGLTWTIPGTGDQIESTNGQLTGTWALPGGAQVNSNNISPNFAAGVGARVQWNTDIVAAGRRVRGSTFLTNLAVGNFDNQGTIDSGAVGTLSAAANALALVGSLVVWSRPRASLPNGTLAEIVSATVPDRVTALRTRRY